MIPQSVRVLVVEASAATREWLVSLFDSHPRCAVAGTARSGEQAIAETARTHPDVVVMDVDLQGMNGFEATRAIMSEFPTPIVIVSVGAAPEQALSSFRAIEAGALTVVAKPHGPGHPDHAAEAKELIRTVIAMSEVKVVRRRQLRATEQVGAPAPPSRPPGANGPVEIVAIGASTGGPQALQVLLSLLPRDLPVPMAIVQHMTSGFLDGYADWLSLSTGRRIGIAMHQQDLLPGGIYLAPDGYHLTVGDGCRAILVRKPSESGPCPAVASLFGSLARADAAKCVALLLSGMGADGARELKALKDLGAVVAVQDRASSVIWGMPSEALRLDPSIQAISPSEMAALIAIAAPGGKRNGGAPHSEVPVVKPGGGTDRTG